MGGGWGGGGWEHLSSSGNFKVYLRVVKKVSDKRNVFVWGIQIFRVNMV